MDNKNYLYYCDDCNSLDKDEQDNLNIDCKDCGRRLYPLHVSEEQWDYMPDVEKRSVIENATKPRSQARTKQKGANTNQQRQQSSNYQTKQNSTKVESGKFSTLSIISLVMSCTCCLSIVGLILGIIDLNLKDGSNKTLSIVSIVVSGVIIGVYLISLLLGVKY